MVKKSLNYTSKSTLVVGCLFRSFVAALFGTVMVGTWAWALPYDELDGRSAMYEVPVSPTLKPFASYPIHAIEFNIKGNQAFIGYHLPKELTGLTTSEIILKGEVGAGVSFEIKGTGGAAGVCLKATPEHKIFCRIKYDKLDFDLAARRKILRSEFTNPLELAARTQVARIFSNEPVGILSFNE